MIIKERNKLDLTKYPNELGLIKFDFSDLLKQTSSYWVGRDREKKDKRIEDEIGFPAWVEAFWEQVKTNQKIPTDKEYYDYYVEKNQDALNQYNFTNHEWECFMYRVYRVYPSLVRDCAFSLFLREDEDIKKEKAEVRYNVELDLNGIDILIVREDREMFGLDCHAGTEKSISYKENEKPIRNPNFPNVWYADMPIGRYGYLSSGSLHLYYVKDANYAKRIIFPDREFKDEW